MAEPVFVARERELRHLDTLLDAPLAGQGQVCFVSRQDLRCMFGMVLQDSWLFNGTVMDNIRYGYSEATDEQVRGRLDGPCRSLCAHPARGL